MNFTIRSGGKEDFTQVFALMEKAFPKTEHRSQEGQHKLFQNPAYSYRILQDEAGKFLGFLAVWNFHAFRFAEHFAVNENARGHGIGGQALQMWMKEEDTPVVLEVELPETEIARRRIGFYQRLGFVLNEFPYRQPSMQEGQPSIPLKIMSWPKALSQEVFAPWQQQIYHEVYGQK